jgi:mannosyl-oligosaccharide alpha-1,2-mannosidase
MLRRNQTFFPQTAQQVEQLAKYGFWVVDPRYRLRPEYVESLFYAYRITGEERYRDWAWQAFVAMQDHCRTEWTFAGVADVMDERKNLVVDDEDYDNVIFKKTIQKGKGGDAREPNAAEVEEEAFNWIDEQESFWSAETLKYLYLIFEDVETYKLDDWVFTTEGHLVKRRE